MQQQISKRFIAFSKRAEKIDHQTLVDSFVDIGPLLPVLSTYDNQILYGRRGTGKTHALIYLAEARREAGDVSVYVDLRQVGSTGGLYSDPAVPLPERATRLLVDVLCGIHDGLVDFALADEATLDLSQVAPILDDMADAVTEVRIAGTTEEELSGSERQKAGSSGSAVVEFSMKHAGVSGSARSTEESEIEGAYRRKVAGAEVHRVNFGRVGDVFSRLSEALSGMRLWVILDEWSVVPLELQPYLADLLRRSLFPVPSITVKIGAIEKRSRFMLALDSGEYLGIELGGDASADLNMDDFMVFDNDEEQAVAFFSNMVFRHFQSAIDGSVEGMPNSPQELVRVSFTQENVFRELVRAAEGIPRDALYVLALAAQTDYGRPISMETIRKASKTWYQRDKETAVSANSRALALLHWIIDKVIAHRRARAFLLQRTVTSELIDSLFDARVLHLLKRNISAHDRPGIRYDVYKVDYGCYVDLLLTIRAPLGLLSDDSGSYIDVPPDDYRAIRRAILDIEEFERTETNQ